MRSRPAVAGWRVPVGAGLAAALLLTTLSAQEKAAAKVSLGFAAAPPGQQVTIPLLLEGAAGKNVLRLVSEVRFPAAHLVFVRLESAASLREPVFEAVAELGKPAPSVAGRGAGSADGPQKQKVTELQVRVSSRDDSRPLPDGIVAYLVFRIPPRIKPDKTPEIALEHEAKIFVGSTSAPSPLTVIAKSTKVIVETPGLPIIGCFFYMH